MILGCDIGTAFTKAVLANDNLPKYFLKVPTEANPEKAINNIFKKLKQNYNVDVIQINDFVVTGWGEDKLSLKHIKANMINCIIKGAIWAFPSCRSILHLGAQQIIIITLNDKGKLFEFKLNDKCATGAGRFLEVICEALDLNIEEIPEIYQLSDREITITSQCAVFSESEVVSLINDGEDTANILKAIINALGRNVSTQTKSLKLKQDCIISGGIAKIIPLNNYIKETLKTDLKVFRPEPDYITAVGAIINMI